MADPISQSLDGYATIRGGTFQKGYHKGKKVAPFQMKKTPVTNAEYGALATSLGQDRFVLLRYNWKSGEARLEKKGRSVEEVTGGPATLNAEFDKRNILVLGSAILVKMVDNPSAQYDQSGRVFSGANQPAVGVTYFHAKAWCLLKTLESKGKFKYDLPTYLQYKYVANDRGTKEYGTETGTLYKGERKLAHVGEYEKGTVAVDDPRYAQKLPFGVQTNGNVWRWINFDRLLLFFKAAYGMRGGSWSNGVDDVGGHIGDGVGPDYSYNNVGFSPIRR